MIKKIAYRDGYKYQLAADYTVQTAVRVPDEYSNAFLLLCPDGLLTVREGYSWDGPSGPTIDTKNFMRGSLVHDALYQLMRERFLNEDEWREVADAELRRICIEDGMSRLRAWFVYQAVRHNGRGAALPDNDKPLIGAP